jgi:transcription termination/antitermination protein NusG
LAQAVGARAEDGSTEGGEALLTEPIECRDTTRGAWHVLWTHSHCEQAVHDHLAARGFHPFLPKLRRWSRRAGLRHLVDAPLFPGYLFLNDCLNKDSHVEVRKTRGLASILGERWDRPATVPTEEIEAIRRLAGSGLDVLPHLYLAAGQRVRVAGGPLQGVEGHLVRHRAERGLVVVSVHLLQRSVAVEMDITNVEPA